MLDLHEHEYDPPLPRRWKCRATSSGTIEVIDLTRDGDDGLVAYHAYHVVLKASKWSRDFPPLWTILAVELYSDAIRYLRNEHADLIVNRVIHLRLPQALRLARVACAIARHTPAKKRLGYLGNDGDVRRRCWLPYLIAAVANCMPGAPLQALACDCRAGAPYFVDQRCYRKAPNTGERRGYVRRRRLDADPDCKQCSGSGFKARPPQPVQFLNHVLE